MQHAGDMDGVHAAAGSPVILSRRASDGNPRLPKIASASQSDRAMHAQSISQGLGAMLTSDLCDFCLCVCLAEPHVGRALLIYCSALFSHDKGQATHRN